MSTVIAKNIQIGTSGTAAQNFTWYQPAAPDGTVRLGVGNTGATTLDAVTVANTGNVTLGGTTTLTNISYSGTLTGGTGIVNVGSGQFYKDASGNVGIGTSSPTAKIGIPVPEFSASSTAGMIRFQNPNVSADSCIQSFYVASAGSDLWLGANSYVDTSGNTARFNASYASSFIDIRRDGSLQFGTNTSSGVATERARIDSSGNLLVGTTSNPNSAKIAVGPTASNGISIESNSTSVVMSQLLFRNPNGIVGSVTTSGSSTAYNTSSDYRLKHDIQPMTGALAKVAALKPVTYKWNVDNSAGEGFIAHELQAVVPGCVTGEKDAVDADGKPVYQGIDTSFLVATLTAAIQEQQALIESLTARIAALEAK